MISPKTQETSLIFILFSFIETLQDLINDDAPYAPTFATVFTDGVKLLKLTDKDIAQQFGVSRTTINRWKTGKNEPCVLAKKEIYTWFVQKINACVDCAPGRDIFYCYPSCPEKETALD